MSYYPFLSFPLYKGGMKYELFYNNSEYVSPLGGVGGDILMIIFFSLKGGVGGNFLFFVGFSEKWYDIRRLKIWN